MSRSKYDKENPCIASRSDSVDLTVDARSSDGFPIRDADYGRVAS
jgi:hypothetical protein